jgi:transposase-like protein
MGPAKLEVNVAERTAGEVAKLMAVIAEHWPQAKVSGYTRILVEMGGVLAAECRQPTAVSAVDAVWARLTEGAPTAPRPATAAKNGSGSGPSLDGANPVPLSVPARRARRHFTADEKRAAVAAIAEHGIAATSRRLEVSQSVLRCWKNRAGRASTVSTPVRSVAAAGAAGQPLAEELVDKIRRDTAAIESQRVALVPSGVHHPVDHDAIRASAYPRDDE